MNIALLGAPGTGKTWLAQQLARHLPAHVFLDAPQPNTHANWDRVLLTGLDWPGGASTPPQSEPRRAEDTRLRAQLAAAGLSYSVVYGPGPQRLRAALQWLFPQESPEHVTQGRWRGSCEKCADPDCEFRLFTGLADRSKTTAARSRI